MTAYLLSEVSGLLYHIIICTSFIVYVQAFICLTMKCFRTKGKKIYTYSM